MTLAVGCTASGIKLPLFFITKGKRDKVCNKLKVPSPHFADFTDSGWMRDHVMIHWLEKVASAYSHGRPCALLVDSHNSHLTDDVYRAADRLHIEIIVVPAGMTSTLQPLDVGVNCVLKAIYRKAWRRRRLFEPEKSVQWDGATELAISAWQKVSPHTVRSSFSKAIDNFPPTQSLSSLRMVESEKRAVLQLVDRLPVRPVRSLSIEVPSRSSSRISSIRSDPCVNDAILARSLVDNDDEFHLTYDEYNNRYFH